MADSQIAPAIPNSQAPYAEAWREFDHLQTLAEMRLWFDLADGIAIAIVAAAIRKLDSVTYWTIIGVSLVIGALVATWIRRSATRFEHWPCPRCHAEWPGTKTEKDLQCAVCGLKLHQMAP